MSQLDISPFLEAKSDQVTADDLIGGPRTFRIDHVEMPGGEQPVLVHLEGMDGKPFKPCKGMRRLLAAMWGLDASKWAGRSITLFRDPDVRFGADQTGGVRVAAVSHIDEPRTVPVRVSRGKAKQYKVAPLADAPKVSQSSDFSGQLAELKALAKPGNMDALGAKWQDIGPDARKALAAELPALKAACEPDPLGATEDVPFDPPVETGASQTREGGNLGPSPADAKVTELKALLDAATTPAAVEAAAAEVEKHKAALTDPQQIALEIAVDNARNRVGAKDGEVLV